MRHALRLLGWSFLSLVSAETVIALMDWSARWDWFKQLMLDHPRFASFIRTPLSYLLLIVVGFAFLFVERKVKEPKIVGRITGLEGLPDTAATPVAMVFIEEKKEPGWNEHPINWHWFAKATFVNESETPTTIDQIKVRLRWKWRKRKSLFTTCKDNFGEYVFAGRNREGWPKDDEIPNLLEALKSAPLTHGIGHEGWMRFDVPQITRKDMEAAKIDFWIVDAMQVKHRIRHNDAEIERVKITKRLSRR